MPVWWGIFAYMMIVSALGVFTYKKKKLSVSTGPVDGSYTEDYKSIGLFFALTTFVLLVFFAGKRSGIFDSLDYQYSYEHYYSFDLSQITDIITGKVKEKGPLFKILLILFKHFTHGTYNDWFTFVALIQCLSIALFLYKYSVDFMYSVFCFFTTSTFLWLVNGMRQFLAVAFILFFVDWIKKRKTIPFILIVIIAYFIHSSALIWIPVYFIINYQPWSFKYVILSIILAIALYLYTRSSFLDDSDYSYLSNADYQKGVNPIRVAFMSIPSVLAFIRREEIEKKKDPFVNAWINLSLITSECYIVSMFTSGVMGRMPVYFQLFNLLLIPWLLDNVYSENGNKPLKWVFTIAFLVYFWYDMYIAGNGIYVSKELNINYWYA